MTATSLYQTSVWVDAAGVEHDIDTMDPDYRSNVIGFLRRNARALQDRAFVRFRQSFPDDPSDGVAAAMDQICAELEQDPAEWIDQTPLMQRLLELDAGRTRLQRAKTAVRNKAYEVATGYRKKTFKEVF